MADPRMVHDPRVLPPTGPAGQLAQVVAQAVQHGLAPISARLAAIEEEGERTGHIVNGLLGHLGLRAEQQAGDPAEETKAPLVDTIWCCKKCGTRLGMYDGTDDVMRLRHKEFIAHTHIGIGGWVRVVCKGCAELNVVEYTTGVTDQDGQVHQLQVGGDRLLVDEPLLLHLLELVRAAEGRLVVQLVQAPQPSPQ